MKQMYNYGHQMADCAVSIPKQWAFPCNAEKRRARMVGGTEGEKRDNQAPPTDVRLPASYCFCLSRTHRCSSAPSFL